MQQADRIWWAAPSSVCLTTGSRTAIKNPRASASEQALASCTDRDPTVNMHDPPKIHVSLQVWAAQNPGGGHRGKGSSDLEPAENGNTGGGGEDGGGGCQTMNKSCTGGGERALLKADAHLAKEGFGSRGSWRM